MAAPSMSDLTELPAESTARRLHRLVELIHLVSYCSHEPTDALMALGHQNYWDGYFAALDNVGSR